MNLSLSQYLYVFPFTVSSSLAPPLHSWLTCGGNRMGIRGRMLYVGTACIPHPSQPYVQQIMSQFLDGIGVTPFRVGPLRLPLSMAGGASPTLPLAL